MTEPRGYPGKLFRDDDSVPIYPPETMERVELILHNGPGLHRIEHSHYAPTVEDMFMLAPKFVVLIPTQQRGENNKWLKVVGGHCKVLLPIAIVSSKRINDTAYDMFGRASFPDWFILRGAHHQIEIRGYDLKERRARVFLSRHTYKYILDIWMDKKIEAAAS